MPLSPDSITTFEVDGNKAAYIPCPTGKAVQVHVVGDTVYYDSANTVTSDSNDGSIATATSETLTSPIFVRTATGDLARVQVTTVSGTEPITAGPVNIRTWQNIAATSGTDKACANGTVFVASIFVPVTVTATGIGYLVGSVGGTDSVIATLFDKDGSVVANSDTDGAVVGTAAQEQKVDFLSPTTVLGPDRYWLGLTFNGTTAKFRSIPAQCGGGILTDAATQTFGTVADITVPTTFTADEGPAAFLY